jgi:polyphosphate kinase 2 (PPK2 family)
MKPSPRSPGFAPFGSASSPATTTAAALQSRVASRTGCSETRSVFVRTLSAQANRRVLILLKAVNAGGKDGVIEELVSLTGDDGVRIERLRESPPPQQFGDRLEAVDRLAPAPGELVFFNRSYYGTPVRLAWERRLGVGRLCDLIMGLERRFVAGGIVVVKLFLHIDRSEQLRRLLARQERPELRHLHNPRDFVDQDRWDDLMRAYDAVMLRTHSTSAPWIVAPGRPPAISATTQSRKRCLGPCSGHGSGIGMGDVWTKPWGSSRTAGSAGSCRFWS